jgi:hypothetical protein
MPLDSASPLIVLAPQMKEHTEQAWVFKKDGIEDFQGPYAEWKGKHN